MPINRKAEFIPPQGWHVQEHPNNSNAFASITLKRHECRAPFARFVDSLHSKFRVHWSDESDSRWGYAATPPYRFEVRCRAERLHRFGVDEVGRVGLFEARWLQLQCGNCLSSGAALQDLAEDSTAHKVENGVE